MKTIRSGTVLCLAFLFLLAAPRPCRGADTFISPVDFWFYRDNGREPGTAWRLPEFNHFDWDFGVSQFGFGEGDEFTELNPSPNGAPLNTAYFRTRFSTEPGNYSNVTVRLLRDDGAIVYINGLEVFRNNMPAGNVSYATSARRNIDGADEFIVAQRVIPAGVLSGINTVAVEVHQAAGGSEDMSFALQLIGHRVGENQPPSAQSSFISVEQDKTVGFSLSATDPDSNPLNFTIFSAPQHGTLSGLEPNLIYTPEPGYVGPDLFSFTATDGEWETEVAYVSIDVVLPSNRPPEAQAQSPEVNEDEALGIALSATDPDGDALTYTHTLPAHGTLSSLDGQLIYQPAPNYHGPDSLTFSADDGEGGTSTATVSITVVPVNDAPVASAQEITVDEDTSISIALSASDVDGDALALSYVQPSHGSLTGSGHTVVYLPTAEYNGTDSFSFTVDDGKGGTSTAVVSIIITPVNDAPVASSQEITVGEDTSAGITLSATDVDGDVLVFSSIQPTHGTVNGSGSTVIYMPAANYNGPDSFTFTVNDGHGGTATGTVNITVSSVNDAPMALAKAASVSDPTNFTRNLAVVATNNHDARIIIDGVASFDVDGVLSYAWHQDSNPTPFSTASNTIVTLPIGSYTLTLVVSDNVNTASDTITVQVFSPCDVVQNLVAKVEAAALKPSDRNGLLGHLNAACSTFSSGNGRAGVRQLQLFQSRVSKQVNDPATAHALNEEAQRIIDEVSGE